MKERTRHVTTKDAAVQLSSKIPQQQLTKVITEIVNQRFAAANNKKQHLQKKFGMSLTISSSYPSNSTTITVNNN